MNNKQKHSISIIGARAYPSNFIGTSGVETYLEKILDCLTKYPNYHFRIYVKSSYQSHMEKIENPLVQIIPVWTVRSKLFESLIYSILSSLLAVFDSSDTVWYHAVGPALFSFIPRLFGKKVVVTVHSLDWQRDKWNGPEKLLFRLATGCLFVFPPKITTVSESIQIYLKKNYGIRASYTPPGITMKNTDQMTQTEAFRKIIKKPYVLFLGRIVPEKRLEWLIEALASINKEKVHYRLVIAGGQGNTPAYEKQLKEQYSDDWITWQGYIFGKPKEALLVHCACFALPSNLEGTSISLLEAIGYGKYCVSAKEYTPTDLQTLHNVILFHCSDKQSFFTNLQKALGLERSHPGYRYNSRENRILRKYSWDKTAEIYARLFLKK